MAPKELFGSASGLAHRTMGNQQTGKPKNPPTNTADRDAFTIYETEYEREAQEAMRRRQQEEKALDKQSADAFQRQQQLIEALQAQAAGGSSIAETQAAEAMRITPSQQLAAIQAQRGGSLAANQRQFQRGSADLAAHLNQQVATQRIGEQQQAQASLAPALENVRAQQQQAQVIYEDAVQYYISQGLDLEMARQQALENMKSIEAGISAAQMDQDAARSAAAAAKRQQTGQAIGAGLGAVGGALIPIPGVSSGVGAVLGGTVGSALGKVFSDENTKQKIKSGSQDIKEFLDAIAKRKA